MPTALDVASARLGKRLAAVVRRLMLALKKK
jgi:hypothetical protein